MRVRILTLLCLILTLPCLVQAQSEVNTYVTRAASLLKPSPGGGKPPLQNVEDAVRNLEIALRMDPRNFYARHNYAHAAYLLGYPAVAIDQFTKAITLNPRSGRSYLGRGYAHFQACELEAAASDFNQAMREDPALRSEVASQQKTQEKKQQCNHPPAPPSIRQMPDYCLGDRGWHFSPECTLQNRKRDQ